MALKIEITQEHIKRGKIRCPWSCPIALAFKGAGYRSVDVTHDACEVDGESHVLPRKARAFIEKFDSGQNVKPFSFLMRGGA